MRLPRRNPGFFALIGVAQLAMTLTILLGLAKGNDSGVFGVLQFWSPAIILAGALVLAGVGFASIDAKDRGVLPALFGGLHGLIQVGLAFGWAQGALALYHGALPGGALGDWLLAVMVLVGTPTLVGLIGAELVAVNLLLASLVGLNTNEVFAGQSIEDYKGFLRLRIGPDGELTIYPIKLERVCSRWKANPQGARTEPWLLPDGQSLDPELVERPIRVPRVARRHDTVAP